jgi:amino acid transporter
MADVVGNRQTAQGEADRSERQYREEQTGKEFVAVTDLRAGALRLPSVVIQAITNVSPAAAVFFTFAFTVSLGGIVTPWAFILTSVLVLMIAVVLAQLAKAFPSAGGYYTYISRTLHPRLGFMSGWAFALYMPPVTGVVLGYVGFLLHGEFEKNYSVNIPWWVFMLVGAVVVFAAMYSGIKPSLRLMIALTAVELAIVLVLSVWGFFAPGPGGFSLQPLNPGDLHVAPDLFLAVVFSLFSYSGWEGAAPLAEESVNPRRNVPLALVGSVVFFAALFVVCTTGLLNGWGVNRVGSIAGSAELPPLVLAHRFWGSAWWIVLFALVNTVLANSIAALNVSTRMTFAMARSGALPRALGVIHKRTKTPVNAIHLQVVLFLFFGVICALIVGVDKLYFFFGFVVTFVLALVYALGNIGAARYYLTEGRKYFNPFLHVVLPVASTGFIVYLVYKTFNPYPAFPYNWALPVTGVWLAVGIGVLVIMSRRGKEDWLIKASDSVSEMPIEAAGLAARAGHSPEAEFFGSDNSPPSGPS